MFYLLPFSQPAQAALCQIAAMGKIEAGKTSWKVLQDTSLVLKLKIISWLKLTPRLLNQTCNNKTK